KIAARQVAFRAHAIYIEGLPEDQRPSLVTFRQWVNGKYKDLEIWALLEMSGVIETQVKIDPTRKLRAFEQVIAQLKASGEKATPKQAAIRAHAIYIEGLPEDQRPSPRTFRKWVSGKTKDAEISTLLEKSGVLLKK
ncbi:MAG TPA: hypothetical protein VFW62_10990, partial [bacterium]|nr:hypothetical protein [bacterium]